MTFLHVSMKISENSRKNAKNRVGLIRVGTMARLSCVTQFLNVITANAKSLFNEPLLPRMVALIE